MTAPTTIPAPGTGPAPAPAPAAERTPGSEAFEPVILGFTCNWCSYRAADLAGTARTKYPPNVRLIRLMCSGRMEPEFILEGFAKGADAVVMTGCWPEDCHYRIQSVKALRRFLFVRRMLTDLGYEPGRLQRFSASAAEGQRFADEMARIVEEVRTLGPIDPTRRSGLPQPTAASAPSGAAHEPTTDAATPDDAAGPAMPAGQALEVEA
jgi:F420-non-reducing hydrogenase iron-sulfur subunit